MRAAHPLRPPPPRPRPRTPRARGASQPRRAAPRRAARGVSRRSGPAQLGATVTVAASPSACCARVPCLRATPPERAYSEYRQSASTSFFLLRNSPFPHPRSSLRVGVGSCSVLQWRACWSPPPPLEKWAARMRLRDQYEYDEEKKKKKKKRRLHFCSGRASRASASPVTPEVLTSRREEARVGRVDDSRTPIPSAAHAYASSHLAPAAAACTHRSPRTHAGSRLGGAPPAEA